MPSLASITGSYFFLLFGWDGPANNKWWVLLVGVDLHLPDDAHLRDRHRAQRPHAVLPARRRAHRSWWRSPAVALYKVLAGDLPGSVDPSLSWLNPFDLKDTSALADGMVIAIFLYWGWDTAVTVNEETKDSRRTPGPRRGRSRPSCSCSSYLIVAIAAQAVKGPAFLTANSDDVLSATGNLVLSSPFDKFLIIAVLSSAAASTQTTILPAARSELSMAAHRAAPMWFGRIDPKFLSPANATWFFGILAIVWYAGLQVLSDDVLGASIAAVGLAIAFYYALTGFACVIYFRKSLFTSVKNFLFVGVAPFLGAVILTWVLYKAGSDLYKDTESYGELFGIGLSFVVGIGLLLLGIPFMLLWWMKAPEFFRRKRDPFPRPGARRQRTTGAADQRARADPRRRAPRSGLRRRWRRWRVTDGR